jgi:hypothetical protein
MRRFVCAFLAVSVLYLSAPVDSSWFRFAPAYSDACGALGCPDWSNPYWRGLVTLFSAGGLRILDPPSQLDSAQSLSQLKQWFVSSSSWTQSEAQWMFGTLKAWVDQWIAGVGHWLGLFDSSLTSFLLSKQSLVASSWSCSSGQCSAPVSPGLWFVYPATNVACGMLYYTNPVFIYTSPYSANVTVAAYQASQLLGVYTGHGGPFTVSVPADPCQDLVFVVRSYDASLVSISFAVTTWRAYSRVSDGFYYGGGQVSGSPGGASVDYSCYLNSLVGVAPAQSEFDLWHPCSDLLKADGSWWRATTTDLFAPASSTATTTPVVVPQATPTPVPSWIAATATAIAQSTASAQATATAQVQATATAQARSTATVLAQLQQTATAQAAAWATSVARQNATATALVQSQATAAAYATATAAAYLTAVAMGTPATPPPTPVPAPSQCGDFSSVPAGLFSVYCAVRSLPEQFSSVLVSLFVPTRSLQDRVQSLSLPSRFPFSVPSFVSSCVAVIPQASAAVLQIPVTYLSWHFVLTLDFSPYFSVFRALQRASFVVVAILYVVSAVRRFVA